MTRPNVIIRCGQCHTTMRDPPPIVRCSMCGRGPAMTASKIQRMTAMHGDFGIEFNPHDDGEAVRYADHLASLTTLTAERDELAKRVRELEGALTTAKERYVRAARPPRAGRRGVGGSRE